MISFKELQELGIKILLDREVPGTTGTHKNKFGSKTKLRGGQNEDSIQ
jgi:hypothetical protein